MSDFLIDIATFSQGLQVLDDTTNAPLGSARLMQNMMITDRGGIAPRPGTELLGTYNSNTEGCCGFYNYVKTGVQTELLVKDYNGRKEYFHPDLQDWYLIKSGYTLDAEFGYKEHLINTQNEDYLYFGNAYENYSRWQGSYATTVGAFASGTVLTVDSTLKDTAYLDSTITDPAVTGTAFGTPTTTTLADNAKSFTTNQYGGFFIKMTSGTNNNLVRQIVSNTSTTFTFAAFPNAASAGDTYQILASYYDGSNSYIADTSQTWAASQWNGFYLLITSGTNSGKLFFINATTTHGLSFIGLGSDPGTGFTYEIRMIKFPTSGTLTVGSAGTAVKYSAIPTSTTFTITDPGVAIPGGSAVTVLPDEFPGAPKGNRLENHHTRMVVGGVRSGMSRNAAGTLQGSQSTATVYISRIKDASDFTFSSPRVAGEGDLVTAPYGGGNITDVMNFEDSFAVFKKMYIELDQYPTSDTNDVLVSTPLKTGFGSVGHVVKGKDDVYFITTDNQIASLSRVQLKDTVPQSTNIGIVIKRLLDTYGFDQVNGDEYKQRLFFTCKQSPQDNKNNQVIVFNRQTNSFEGIWSLPAYGFQKNGTDFYYAESSGPNVWKMFTGVNDVRTPAEQFGITASWKSNWLHVVPRRSKFRVKPSQFAIQGINSLGYEGYIKDGTKITFSLYKDFANDPSLSFSFGNISADQGFISGGDLGAFLGDNPLGLEPLGTISAPDPDGNRHFRFVVFFPDIYSNYISLGVDSSGLNQSYEVIRIGVGTTEDTAQDAANVKDITST